MTVARKTPSEQIIGAWHQPNNSSRGATGLLIVYRTELGTAHAGDLRKPWRIPDNVLAGRTETLVDALVSTVTGEKLAVSPKKPASALASASALAPPTIDPDRKLIWGWSDQELAEAFERLLKEPSFAKITLNDWEFKLAADAPGVFLRWGGFTWKQRKHLREVAEKIMRKR